MPGVLMYTPLVASNPLTEATIKSLNTAMVATTGPFTKISIFSSGMPEIDMAYTLLPSCLAV